MFMTTMYRCRIKNITMKVLVFNSLAEAKNRAVEPGKFYFIKDKNLNITDLTRTWKESEGSSLPKEIRENPEHQEGILVKVTGEKVKFYYLEGRKSCCTELPYSVAVESILG